MKPAAQLIREARTIAQLTQAELGARARVTQSVVSAYESGRRDPGFETLCALLDAAGFRLELIPETGRSKLSENVQAHRRELTKAITKLGGANIRVFGSVARGDDGPGSDVDLLIDVGDHVGIFALGQMRFEAERILGVPVDVVPSNSLKPHLAAAALGDAVLL